MSSLFPRHTVIDDFLPTGLHDALLAWVLDRPDSFVPSRVFGGAEQHHASDYRQSLVCRERLGPFTADFCAAIDTRLEALKRGAGLPTFVPARAEIQLVAHRNGGFYRPHTDTLTGDSRTPQGSDRMLTLVYYFNAQPLRFSGGELALLPFGDHGDPLLIAPLDNRIVGFPAIAPHEVLPVTCDEAFAAARFSVNIWLHRARGDTPQPGAPSPRLADLA